MKGFTKELFHAFNPSPLAQEPQEPPFLLIGDKIEQLERAIKNLEASIKAVEPKKSPMAAYVDRWLEEGKEITDEEIDEYKAIFLEPKLKNILELMDKSETDGSTLDEMGKALHKDRYLLFAHAAHSPAGGWCDFNSSHKSIESAINTFDEYSDKNQCLAEIVDLSSMETALFWDGDVWLDHNECVYRPD